jgi:hypothetical protein
MWQWVIIGVAALLGGFLLLVAWCSLVVGARADEAAERIYHESQFPEPRT